MIVWTVNWGRGVDAARFRRNAAAVLEQPGRRDESSVYGIQELDEADAPDEHGIVSQLVGSGTTRVGWGTLEPILVGRRFKVLGRRVTAACKGLAGWTPNRTIVEAMVVDPNRPGVPAVVVMNGHPPRYSRRPAVWLRIRRFRRAHKARVEFWHDRGVTTISTLDANDRDYPPMHQLEKTAVHVGLDYIRYVEHPQGAQVEVREIGTVPLDIDGHDAHWARLILTAPVSRP